MHCRTQHRFMDPHAGGRGSVAGLGMDFCANVSPHMHGVLALPWLCVVMYGT